MIMAGPLNGGPISILDKRILFRLEPAWLDQGAPDRIGFVSSSCAGNNLAEFVNRQSTTNAWAIWAANLLFGR